MTNIDMNLSSALGERLKHYTVKWTEYSAWTIITLFGIIAAMFIFNGFGTVGMGLNLLIFIVGLVVIFLAGTSLPSFGAALAGSGIAAGLSDQDVTQGIASGPSKLIRLTMGVAIGWIIVAGLLSTIPFQWHLGVFLTIMAGSMAMAIVNEFWKIAEGKWLAWSILIYCAIIMIWSLGSLFEVTKNLQEKASNTITTGKTTTPEEDAAAFADQLAEAKRVAEISAAQKVAEAAATAKAAEAARLTEEVSRNLPTTIRVPLCKDDDEGNTRVDSMSTPIQIPAKWGFVAAWKVGSTPFAVLKDGEWKVATSFSDMENIDAVRFCTNSSAHADLGDMSLSWYAK